MHDCREMVLREQRQFTRLEKPFQQHDTVRVARFAQTKGALDLEQRVTVRLP
ncbi:hypothetical protein D3C83_308870 [compost metagenome]